MADIGYNTIGGTIEAGGHAAGFTTFFKFVAGSSFIAKRLFTYSKSSSTSSPITMGIFADNAGAVGTKLGTTAEATLPNTAGWVSANLAANVTITSGQTYWLALSVGTNAIDNYYDTAAFDSAYVAFTYSSGVLPGNNPSTTAWYTDREFSMYADDGGVVQSISFTDSGGNAITDIPSNHGSGSLTVKVVGSGTSWTGSESWTVSGVTGWSLTSATFVDSTHYTLLLGCPAAASPPSGTTGTLTISDTTDSLSGTLAVATPTISISPATGDTGTTPTITFTGTNTLWTNETAAGLFTVSGGTGDSVGTPTVTTNTAATATLTVGSATGTLTLTDSSTGATASFAATATIAVTNTDLYFSPFNWYSDGAGSLQSNNIRGSSTKAICNTPGGYLKFSCTLSGSGTIILDLDTTSLNGLASGEDPTLAWSIDGLDFQTSTLSYATGTTQLTLASGLSAGTHTVLLYFQDINPNAVTDRWTTPKSAVYVTGVHVTGSLNNQTVRSKTMVIYGDSITEGYEAGVSLATDATSAYGDALGWALDAEYGNIGFSAQGWITTGFGNVPDFYNATDSLQSWDQYYSGASRLFSGSLSPVPDYIVVVHGQNDSNDTNVATAVAAWLAAIRAAASTSWIFVVIPFTHQSITGVTNGFNSYQASTPDSKCVLIDLGTPITAYIVSTGLFSHDGIHPTTRGHAVIGAMMSDKIQAQIGGGTPGALLIGPSALVTPGGYV